MISEVMLKLHHKAVGFSTATELRLCTRRVGVEPGRVDDAAYPTKWGCKAKPGT